MMIKRHKITSYLLYLILIAMSISPVFALDSDNKNLLLVSVMALSPIIIIRYLEFSKNDLLLIIFLIVIIIFTLLNHPQNMRWSTVIYTMLFCITFMAYSRLLRNSNTNIIDYSTVLKWLIYAYTIVLIIQQFCVLTGLPVFNLGNYDILTPWKLNSLTSEPSHSARFMGILMYSYIVSQEIFLCRGYNFSLDARKDKIIWISFFWTMLTMVSATAFIFIFIVFMKFMNRRNIIFLLTSASLVIAIANALEIKAFTRMQKSLIATISLNEEKIIEADHSGAYRIVPIILSAKEVDLSTADGWFGNGIDYMGTIIYKKIPGTPRGYSNGGMMLLAAEYGFLAFILFIIFTIRTTIRRKDIETYLFWFVMVFSLSINMQMLWCAVLLLYTNKYFLNKNQDISCLISN